MACMAGSVWSQTLTRVSAGGNDDSDRPSISQAGHVAFTSQACNLVADDTCPLPDPCPVGSPPGCIDTRTWCETWGCTDVFLYNPNGGTISRVSLGVGGVEGNDDSWDASVSANGRYIAFTSVAGNMHPDDRDGDWDVYLHDRESGATFLVSRNSDDLPGNKNSSSPDLSPDARFVAFASSSSNLVDDDTNGFWDVFVRAMSSGTTWRVSLNSSGEEGNSSSAAFSKPAISADGLTVAFDSFATNLVSNDSNEEIDVFVRVSNEFRTVRVSESSVGLQGDNESSAPVMTPDGRFVAFHSLAGNLVAGDGNALWDVFVRDRDANRNGIFDESGAVSTVRVSVNAAGAGGNDSSLFPDISDDGRYVAFYSYATNLLSTPDTNESADVFVHDRDTDVDGIFDEPGAVATFRVSMASNGLQANGPSSYPVITRDGRYVAFESRAFNLVPGDTEGSTDVFLTRQSRRDDIVIDFGDAGTLYSRMNDSSWLQLSGLSPGGVGVGDLDGDARDDVVADFESTLGAVYGKLNLGAWRQLLPSVLARDVMAIGDLDNSLKADIVYTFAGRSGLFAKMDNSWWSQLSNGTPEMVLLANLDGKQGDDVIGYFSASGGIFIKRNFPGVWWQLHGGEPRQMTAGDLDGDGRQDLVVIFEAVPEGLWVWLNDTRWLKVHNRRPDFVAVGDVDGNGTDDLLATYTAIADGLWGKLGVGSGWVKIGNNAPDQLVTGDVDGSGADDIVADFGSSIGGTYIKRDLGAWTLLHGASPESMVTGELDGR